MKRWLPALLLLIPLADALFLVVVADALGWELTVALVVLTALLGLVFVRAEGRHTLRKLQQAAVGGESPGPHLLDGALLLVAGAFLLTPGLVTDTIGFLLVIPPTRYVVREGLSRFVVAPYLERKTGGFVSGNVYTFGFPNDDSDGGVGAGGFGPGPGGGPGGSSGPGSGGARGSGERSTASGQDGQGSTIDIDGDSYDVVDGGDGTRESGRDANRDSSDAG